MVEGTLEQNLENLKMTLMGAIDLAKLPNSILNPVFFISFFLSECADTGEAGKKKDFTFDG